MLCTSAWPVVTFDAQLCNSDSLVKEFEKDFVKVLNRARDGGRRIVLFIDPSEVENVSHTDIMGMGKIINRHRDLVRKSLRCSYVVVGSTLWRSVMRVVFSLAPPSRPVHMASSTRKVRNLTIGAFIIRVARMLQTADHHR